MQPELPPPAPSFVQPLFTCPACNELLCDPLTLPCGRSICLTCLPHQEIRDQELASASTSPSEVLSNFQFYQCPCTECGRRHCYRREKPDVLVNQYLHQLYPKQAGVYKAATGSEHTSELPLSYSSWKLSPFLPADMANTGAALKLLQIYTECIAQGLFLQVLYLKRAQLYMMRNQLLEALADIQVAIALNPANGRGHALLNELGSQMQFRSQNPIPSPNLTNRHSESTLLASTGTEVSSMHTAASFDPTSLGYAKTEIQNLAPPTETMPRSAISGDGTGAVTLPAAFEQLNLSAWPMCPEAQVQLHAALAARQEPPPPIDPDLAELQCSLCMNTLLEPVTTPCGHTWCRSCVLQTVDHRLSCPLCRTDLPGWSYFSGRPSNSILTQILERYHAEEYRSRRMAHEAVKEQEVIPIFVCTVLCPGEGQGLHIHEPKYRLMIKRVMETTKKFGVIPPSARPYVGTLVDVLHCRPVQGSDLAQTPEGPLPRLVVMVTGIHRFRILECVNHPDGYHMARIERFDDLDIEDEIAGESPEAGTPSVTTQVMRNYSSAHGGQPSHVNDAEIVRLHLETTRTFVQNLRQYLPPSQLAQFDRQYGPIPSEIADLSFWITQIMPFSQQIKYTLLTCQRPFKRLAMIVACVEQAANG